MAPEASGHVYAEEELKVVGENRCNALPAPRVSFSNLLGNGVVFDNVS